MNTTCFQSLRAAGFVGLASFLCLALPATAQVETVSAASPVAVGLEVGTTGIGPVAEIVAAPQVTVQASYGWLNSTYHVRTRAARYDSDVELSNIGLIANWFPRVGMFHVAGGLFISDNNMKLTTRPRSGSTYGIGNNTYTAAQVGTLVGRVDLGNNVAPFVGVGWTKIPAKRGWGFTSTVGLMFSGSPKASFTASGPIASDPTFQADLAQETRDVNDDIDYKVYPVAKAGFLYRF